MKIKTEIWHSLVIIAILTLSGGNVHGQCSVMNATPGLSFTASGGSKTVFVQTDPMGCDSYSVTQIGPFFSYYRSGGNIVVSCNVNTSTISRSGRLELDGSRYVMVSQAGACPAQNPPGNITSNNSTVCVNGTGTYSTTAVSGATYYSWSVSSGGGISSGQGSLTANIYFSTTGTKTVSVTARNSCLNYSSSRTYTVNVVGRPAAPTSISHNPNMCGGSNYTFSVTPQAGFTYEWVVEGSGYQILGGQGTSSVNVSVPAAQGIIRVRSINSSGCKSDQYSKTVTGTASSPVFYVSGNGSICSGSSTTVHLDASALNYVYTAQWNGGPITGESASAVISLSGNNSSLTFGPFTKEGEYTIYSSGDQCPVEMLGSVIIAFKPAPPDQPGAITQSTQSLCINTSASFSIAAVDRASPTGYTWSTSGSSSITGQGTTSPTINFNSSGTQTVYVTASNSCGVSTAASTTINVVARPAAPSSISHNPNMCGGSNYTFSVPPQAGYTYEWVVEGSGYQILGGQGTSSVNVSVVAGEGIIRVKNVNSTGCKSDQYSKTISGAGGSPVFNVSGNGSICPGTSATVHLDGSMLNYVYTAQRNGGSITGEDPSAVTSLSGNQSSLTFGPFTVPGTYTITSSGDYCPVTMNGSVELVYKPAKPDQPGLITPSKTSICNGGTIDFSIDPVDRATSYTWSSSHGSVTSGQNTTAATMQFSTSANEVLVKVTAGNSCGTSIDTSRYIYITRVSAPTFLPTYPNPCAGGKLTYAVNPTGDYSYEWVAPDGWEILGGQGTSSVQMHLGRYDGTIQVTASRNGCKSSISQLYQDITQPPGVFALSGSTVICEGQTFSLNLNASVTGHDYTLMRGTTSVQTKPGTNSPLAFGPFNTPGTYKVYSSSAGSCTYPMDGEAVVNVETLSVAPTSIEASVIETCAKGDVILTANGGILGDGAVWKWYNGSCGGTAIGTGSTISVRPVANTTYYVRAEGNCNITACASKSITVVSCVNRDALNYVRTRTTKVPGYAALPVNGPAAKIASEYIYIDHLGRQSQRVGEKESSLSGDMLTLNIYDDYGRQPFEYLPAAVANNNGVIVTNPTTVITNFYDINHASHPQKVAVTSIPYSKTIFEDSPENKVLKQGSAGPEWQPDNIDYESTQDHAIKHKYETNAADEVLKWSFTAGVNGTLGLVNASNAATPIYYPSNTLYKHKIKDEDQHEVIEFKDKAGKIILKKVQSEDNVYAQTYYVYDDYDNLICVLPPEAVRLINKTPTSEYFNKSDADKEAFLQRWSFRYKYDSRKRMIKKQVPGSDVVYMVYDNRGRLVLTQDGNQRATTPYYWTFTKYDDLDRPVLTGIKDTVAALTQEEMQIAVNTFYARPGAKWGEKYGNGNPLHGYTNFTYPLFTTGTTADPHHYLTVTYYDNYNFRDQWLGAYNYINLGLSQTVNDVEYLQPQTESEGVVGHITGTKVKILDGGPRGRYTWLKTINYYDDRYRLIQSISDNYKGGQDRTTNLYDFSGKVLKTRITHTTNEISWTGLVNAMVVGNNLLKTVLSNGWSSGGVTAEGLPAGVDGWIECIISEANQRRAFGLTAANEGEHLNTIDYAFWHNETTARIYENGSIKYTFPAPVVSGDVIRIARTGTIIKYYRNGVLQYTSQNASSTALVGDASIDSSIGNILVPRASFNFKADSTTRRFVYDHAGRLTEAWHQINSAPEVSIAHNEYNALGQLVDKKLHSFNTSAADAVQSIDYRYNIRGWLTEMNQIDLANGDSGDPVDHFGFQLAYNNDIGTGTEGLFNGNISAMKWSANLGLSDEVGKAYNYRYDKMNRITAALFKRGTIDQQSMTWSTPPDSCFSERGYRYDLNGNILALRRKGKSGGNLDILEYEYGAGSSQSNQLLTVTDSGSKIDGFTEIDGGGDDYEYDNNGNLVWDKNKGGEDILKNGGFANGSADWVVSDEAGRFTFADDSLNVAPHATSTSTFAQNGIILRYATYVVIVDMERVAGNIRINLGNGGFTSVSNSGKTIFTDQAGSGSNFLVSIPPSFSGRIKSIEVKGVVVISYNHLNLPEKIVKGLQQSLGYIYDANGKKISQEVYDEVGLIKKKSDYEGDFFYENDTLKFLNHEEGRVVMTGPAPEYQYNLEDHLGNVRLTFTTKSDEEVILGTLETANESDERNEFLNYDEAVKINYDLFDHTYNGTTGATYYSTRLTGGNTNAVYGLAKSLSVMPGDTINIEVFAKYLDPNAGNWTSALAAFMSAMSAGTAPDGIHVDGGSPGSIGSGSFPFVGMFNHAGETGTAPKAYLNYIVFDRDYNVIIGQSGFMRITTASRETGNNVAHDRLYKDALAICQPGYVYIYISNENTTPVEVYFDDFEVEHVKSPVVQMDDYYPFGLTFNSYQRENSVDQKFKFQGQEHIDDLNLGWDSFKWRNHMPDIGRFFNVDPLAEKYYYNSPYAFSENKVTTHVELEGLEAEHYLKKEVQKVENAVKAIPGAIADGASKVGNAISNRLGEIGDGFKSVWNSIGPGDTGGGFTLNSENGGVTGGTDQGVREGQGDGMLEVGHLLTPDTRSDAINLVQGVEEETHIIQNATNTTIDNVTDGTGKEISLDVTAVKDTVLDAKNFNQYEVTLPSGKDTVIQRTNNPEIKKDGQR